MKRVVFVDLQEKEFDRGAAEFAERSEMYLPDEYDLLDWYIEQDDVFRIKKCGESNDTFVYELLHPDYSSEMRVVHVIDIENMDYDPEIDFPRD